MCVNCRKNSMSSQTLLLRFTLVRSPCRKLDLSASHLVFHSSTPVGSVIKENQQMLLTISVRKPLTSIQMEYSINFDTYGGPQFGSSSHIIMATTFSIVESLVRLNKFNQLAVNLLTFRIVHVSAWILKITRNLPNTKRKIHNRSVWTHK